MSLFAAVCCRSGDGKKNYFISPRGAKREKSSVSTGCTHRSRAKREDYAFPLCSLLNNNVAPSLYQSTTPRKPAPLLASLLAQPPPNGAATAPRLYSVPGGSSEGTAGFRGPHRRIPSMWPTQPTRKTFRRFCASSIPCPATTSHSS